MKTRTDRNCGRRLLALMLALVMCVSLLNVTALATEGDGEDPAETQVSDDVQNDDATQEGDAGQDDQELTLNFGSPTAGDSEDGEGNGDTESPVLPADNMGVDENGQREEVPGDVTEADKIGELVIDEETGEATVVSPVEEAEGDDENEIAPIDLDALDEDTVIDTAEELQAAINAAEGDTAIELTTGFTVDAPLRSLTVNP